jgi:hypothetical protein
MECECLETYVDIFALWDKMKYGAAIQVSFERETYTYRDPEGRKAYCVDLKKAWRKKETFMAGTALTTDRGRDRAAEALVAYFEDNEVPYHQSREFEWTVAFFMTDLEFNKLILKHGELVLPNRAGFDLGQWADWVYQPELMLEDLRCELENQCYGYLPGRFVWKGEL